MPEPSVVAVLSSGRSGTRWLADGIRELCPGVEVELSRSLYKPRRYFRRYDDPGAVRGVPEVRRHMTRIAQLERPYVETGWPLSRLYLSWRRCSESAFGSYTSRAIR